MDVAASQRNRCRPGVEVDTDHHPAWPVRSDEPDGHRRGPAAEINQAVAGTDVTDKERGDGVNRPACVCRTMPLPQKRLVDGTHVHHYIIASLGPRSHGYVARRRSRTQTARLPDVVLGQRA